MVVSLFAPCGVLFIISLERSIDIIYAKRPLFLIVQDVFGFPMLGSIYPGLVTDDSSLAFFLDSTSLL